MKLQTMLLPTGEFVIIGSSVKTLPPEGEKFKQFREDTGAAAMFLTSEDVEVSDAIFDENASRAWVLEEEDLEGDDPDDGERAEDPTNILYLPHAQLNGTDRSVTLEFTASAPSEAFLSTVFGEPLHDFTPETDAGDALIQEAADAGANFSPAGLVVLTEEQKDAIADELTETERSVRAGWRGIGGPAQNLVEHVDVDQIVAMAPVDPATVTTNERRPRDVPGYAYSPEGPQNHDLDVADLVVDSPSGHEVGENDYTIPIHRVSEARLEVHDESEPALLTLFEAFVGKGKPDLNGLEVALRQLAGGQVTQADIDETRALLSEPEK